MFCNGCVTKKSQKNILVQSVKINNCSYTKKRKEEDSSLYRDYKLFLKFKVVRVDYNITSIFFPLE